MNPTGINVAVTKKGSMTKELFPTWCRQHFVTNLPQGMGKGGQPVILIFDRACLALELRRAALPTAK